MYSMCCRITSDINIVVTAVNQHNLSRDSYTVQPVNRLGRVYRTASYYPSSLGTQLAIASAAEGTSVVVEFPRDQDVRATIRGRTYYGRAEISMRQYETLQVQVSKPTDCSLGHSSYFSLASLSPDKIEA